MQKPKSNIATPRDSYITNQALKGIQKIEPLIHQIRLTSDYWGYQQLQDLFPGQINQPDDSATESHRQTGGLFKRFAYFHLPKTRKRIRIHYNPRDKYLPFSWFFITKPTVEELLELDLCFSLGADSHLKFTSIEYTVDYFCDTPTAVGNLFYVLRRNYYCPYVKRTKTIGGIFNGYSHEQNYSKDRQTNSLYFINFSLDNARPSKLIKFYERGDDDLKSKTVKYWEHNKCDRVRFEITVKKSLLNKLTIRTIPQFLENPRFTELFFPENGRCLLQFRKFKEKEYRKYRPPSKYQNYFSSNTDKFTFECFLEEVLHAKTQKLDLSNSLENYHELDTLIARTKNSIRAFEENSMSEAAERISDYRHGCNIYDI